MTHDDNGGGWAVLAGSGVFFMYLAALIPGLLAILILTVAFAVPLLVPAIPLLLVLGVRKLVRGARRL